MASEQPVPVAQVVQVQPVAVTVPEGAKVGSVVAVQGPMGPAQVAVPSGAAPGQVIQVVMPVAPVAQPLTGLGALSAFLGTASKVEVNQKILWAEALTGGCCEQQNIFDVKLDGRDGPHVLTAKEKSTCGDRVCCKPHHSFLLHISPAYNTDEVIMTLERKGCACTKCCWSPKPCLGCFTCADCCTEEVIVHSGRVDGTPGEIDAPAPLAVIRQPQQCCASGGCTPTVHFYDQLAGKEKDAGDLPLSTTTGPTCFGGCSELCFESAFYLNTAGGAESVAIRHLTPRDCGEICKAFCTDSDNYAVEFGPNATPETKAQAIATAFVLDTMFFEIDQGMCHYDVADKAIVITCCLCFCYGCLCPCECRLHLNNNNGAPPSAENAVGAPPAADAPPAPETIVRDEPTAAEQPRA